MILEESQSVFNVFWTYLSADSFISVLYVLTRKGGMREDSLKQNKSMLFKECSHQVGKINFLMFEIKYFPEQKPAAFLIFCIQLLPYSSMSTNFHHQTCLSTLTTFLKIIFPSEWKDPFSFRFFL